MPKLERSVQLVNKQGLHARPIAAIANVAKQHESVAEIHFDGRYANARNPIELMTLGAAPGATLTLKVNGDDAEALLAELEALILSGFGEYGK